MQKTILPSLLAVVPLSLVYAQMGPPPVRILIGSTFCVGTMAVFEYTGPYTVHSWYVAGSNYDRTTQLPPPSRILNVKWNSPRQDVFITIRYITSIGALQDYSVSHFNIVQSSPAHVSITSPVTAICAGESVRFDATTTNGGDEPFFQWQANGKTVSNTDNSYYNTSSLNNWDRVGVLLTASGCTSEDENPVNSNTIVMNVTSLSVGGSTVSAGSGRSQNNVYSQYID